MSVPMHYQVLRVRSNRWQVIGVSNNPNAFPDRKNAVIVTSPRPISANKAIELAQQHWDETRPTSKEE
jgi:hypothetical protein